MQKEEPVAAPFRIGQEAEFQDVWEKVEPYTMTSRERGYGLWCAVNTVIDNDIPGAFVECGVWRGGSSMLIALTLLQKDVRDREIFLFDTFSGMTDPGAWDVDLIGQTALDLMSGSRGDGKAGLVRASVAAGDVRDAMVATGYDMEKVRLIEGDVRKTLAATRTGRIALLRLDTDFYDSTMTELTELYPRMPQGGILIVDDYGHWQGARRAFDEFFADPKTPYKRPMLWAMDYTGRGAVKLEAAGRAGIKRYDYHPPGFADPGLGGLFPHAEVRNPWNMRWPYLRQSVPHLFRCDTRHDGFATGNATVEEAICLYGLARQFAGKRGLEIGTHFGWTAAHLLAAGLELDCVDPAFGRGARRKQVEEALDQVPGSRGYRLWAGESPGIVGEVRRSQPAPWSFAFVDGDHNGDAPAEDAREVIGFLAPDAMVVFHDMTSPHVAEGLAVCQDAGFSVRLMNTMQILGVAWRGDVSVPVHVPDSNVPRVTQKHLQRFL